MRATVRFSGAITQQAATRLLTRIQGGPGWGYDNEEGHLWVDLSNRAAVTQVYTLIRHRLPEEVERLAETIRESARALQGAVEYLECTLEELNLSGEEVTISFEEG